ncbi:MAG: sigma 54-interacting transcriptional regulator, partial [Clostridiales bacterium]|nr:sigma 54-interacting transcriptional regulator [Clostridiales bacterium]
MNKKIGIIANDVKIKNTILEVLADEVENGEILIEMYDSENEEKAGRLLEAKGVGAIVARGGGYRNTAGKAGVPVIHFKIAAIDILIALKKADRYGKEIILFLSDFYDFDYDEWKDIISSKITVETIYARKGIEENVDKYFSRREQVIIVGEWVPCRYAKSLGMDHVGIEASRESVIECLNYSREIVNSIYDQKYRNEILNTTLDGVHDAVLAINREGRIILFNKRAQELLGRKHGEVVGKSLKEVFPELDFMLEILESKKNIYNEIITLKKATIAGNISLLIVDGNIEGALCSFQDITRLQNLEKKIRYELNKKGLTAKYRFSDIIAFDPAMKETIVKAARTGETGSTVLIYGESGTGKEMIAQSIHNVGGRKDEPFVAINCAALSESLLESELFGYVEGAFTGARKGGKPGLFELAHGGTIFLDEINSISLNLQAKLLRVLEEKEVMRIGSDYVIPLDVRVLAAANEG